MGIFDHFNQGNIPFATQTCNKLGKRILRIGLRDPVSTQENPKRTPISKENTSTHEADTWREKSTLSPTNECHKPEESSKPNRSRHSVHYASALLHRSHGYGSSNHVVQKGHLPRTLPSASRPPSLRAVDRRKSVIGKGYATRQGVDYFMGPLFLSMDEL
ncbi:hypothetical protein NPIL_303831 [Nephila pilipes]|uniref:Uncharacterized protein n=1 Tax=Nephila pilipes TaxID=299642 RepID=A0A8X6TEJ6_NEPPI|nr:hypothetical protein NPIL_303831 [Nephila pilipes]